MAEWTCWLADLRTNAITAEIPLTGFAPSKKLNASGSVTGTWTLSSSWRGGDPYGLTRPARTALYLLRDGRPWWGGILWTSEFDSSSNAIRLGAADWWSYFDHRKVLPALGVIGDVTTIAGLSTVYTAVDQNQIARNLVILAQSHTGGDIGIQLDSTVSGVLRDRTWWGHDRTDVGEALRNLGHIEGGCDIMFDVAADLDTSGRPVRLMRVGTPEIGQMGSPHVFELGGNLLSYTWPSDGTRMVTRQFAAGEGMEVGQAIAVAEDTTKYADGWPLLEADSSESGVSDPTTLQAHADGDLHASRLPVATPALKVRGDGRNASGAVVGPTVGDYGPGDDARVVIQDLFFSAGLDTTMRIVGVDVDPGQDGVELATLTMNPMLDDVA
jgi:hypothetical protein